MSQSRSRALLRALLLGAVLVGCGDGDGLAAKGGPGGPAVSTSVPGWGLEPTATIGGADAREEELLYNVPAVAEDREGRFYVLNFGDKRVLAFDSAGSYLRALGGQGSGPGEFTAPIGLAVSGDALYVLDAAARRISRFRLDDGSYASSIPIDRGPGIPNSLHMEPQGPLLVEFRPAQGISPDSRPVLARVDTATGQAAPVVQLDSVTRLQLSSGEGNRRNIRFFDRPFAPKPVWTVAADGAVLFGNGAEYAVYRAAGGERALAFRADAEAQPVTAADREAYFERNPQLRDSGQELEFPRTKPYFTALRSDPRGYVWVQVPTRGAGQVWEVREVSGRKLGEVALPERAGLVGIGRNALYVIQRDEDDAETLIRFRLTR